MRTMYAENVPHQEHLDTDFGGPQLLLPEVALRKSQTVVAASKYIWRSQLFMSSGWLTRKGEGKRLLRPWLRVFQRYCRIYQMPRLQFSISLLLHLLTWLCAGLLQYY